ncbi:reticulocyte-binding protein PFD0110w-like isoform X3 [Aricia agestis]|uniref:reticulocyte-binding protein PFD0110w-like isoform X3 n=1 Tax=Aricia agestis TaxID=91739 RepID=UPI001C20A3DB|nr:reticulocyte-binding protein PFD0110w-like isoform X3 [Aricia agestis]
MSFVTKRDRVFNEYKLYDLPARNEGKLKAYASCTDARAWSHFITDKTEHLFEIIKRNNEKCRPKYIPTEVIVDTLMMAKNAQISRLKRKIKEFERLLAAYDHLDLDAGQKAEIAQAYATIKAANKELDDMGIDSEVFGTGKSRGDEISRSTVFAETGKSSASEWSYIKEPKSDKTRDEQSDYEPVDQDYENIDQIDQTKDTIFGKCDNRVKFRETGTYAEEDSRIEELQDMIVTKDAKLNAMRNTIVVLENDVCEPYCIYAHIYTALEKIFGILRQNLKYKQYLDLLTLGRDTQNIHIKGKILYKIKVLEKFSIALIAPCNQTDRPQSCTCYRAEVLTSYETTYAESATESSQNIRDKKRAHLIADIIDVDEINEALNDQSKSETDSACYFDVDECNTKNKSRFLIKSLQSSYSELVTCYENLKSEKDLLYVRCQELLKVEDENKCLRNSIEDYNNLWNEMEHLRRRSDSLDKFKAKYYFLLNETTNLNSKYVAESEKNKINSDTIDELRNENLVLNKKLKESSLAHDKEINSLLFKIKEMECTNMCKEQQIKNLSSDIEQYFNKKYAGTQIYEALNRIAKERDQIQFEETCTCKSVAIENLQQEVNKNLEYINELRLDAKLWQEKYDHAVNTIVTLNDEIRILNTRNLQLTENVHEKSNAVDNLHEIVQDKLEQIEILNEELEKQKSNKVLISKEISKYQHRIDSDLSFIKKIELENNNNYEEINKLQNTDPYNNCIANKTHNENKQDILGHPESSHPHSVQSHSDSDYIDDIAHHKTLLNIPERENVVVEKQLDRVNNIHNEIESPEIKKSEVISPIHKDMQDVSIEINKIQQNLKNKLSLLEKEEQFFIKQNSPQADNDFTYLSLSIRKTYDDQSNSNTNIISNDVLSHIKLLGEQSLSTISKYDEIKEQYRKSLILSEEEMTALETEIVKLKDKHKEDEIFYKVIQDKICKQNEDLTEELNRKNNEITILLMEINKIRNSFQKKIETLETEKQKLLNDLTENPKITDFISTFSDKEYSSLNERKWSVENYDQNDAFSQLEILRNDSLATIKEYDNVKEIYRKSLELAKKESEDLKPQAAQTKKLSKSLEELISKYNKLLNEKNELEKELYTKSDELNNLKNNWEKIHSTVQELEPFKTKYDLLYTEKENELINKDTQINELQKSNTFLESEIRILSTTIEGLKKEIHSLEQVCDKLNMDKDKLNTKLEEKNNDLKNIEQQLQYTKKEYSDQLTKTYNLEEETNAMKQHISLLEDDILSMRLQFDSFSKIINEKEAELIDLRKSNEMFTTVIVCNDTLKKENNILQEDLKALKDENKEFKMQNHNIMIEIESMKTDLKIKEAEIIRANESFKDIEEKMKAEKGSDSDRIVELLKKLQLCEQIINKLKEDLTDRNNSISELQNYINNLQEEIKKLNESLELAIENGEHFSQADVKELDHSAQKIKAHYSKAKHNIKPEIVKLQDINKKLKLLKLDSKDKDTEIENVSKINYLENERETIIHNLNQLEVAVLGLSNLSNKSSAKDIIDVLHNIQKAYEDKHANYEEKMQSIQSSYQLLKNKAEEAQEIAEMERKNIKNEKEDNEQKLLQRERKLQDLYKQLLNKDINYEEIIKDLETKLVTQQNLIEKLNKSQEDHKKNLNNEISNLMKIYKNSLADIEELQKKIKVSEDHNSLQSLQINELSNQYQEKCAEIKVLQNVVHNMKNKASRFDIESQTSFEIYNENQNIIKHDIGTNTYSSLSKHHIINIGMSNNMISEDKNKNQWILNKDETILFSKKDDIAKEKEIISEKSGNIIKNKLEKLQTKTLEQFSICTIRCDTNLDDFNDDVTNSIASISSTITDDLSNIGHVSHPNNDKIKTEIAIKLNFIDKTTQTVDDNLKIIVKNNDSVQSSTNQESKNKLTYDNINLPYQKTMKKDVGTKLKKQNITILPKKVQSLSDVNAKGLISKQNEITNQFVSHKKSNESLNGAIKYLTAEKSQNVYIATKQNCDDVSEDQLDLYSKAKSLDNLTQGKTYFSQELPYESYEVKKEYENKKEKRNNTFFNNINVMPMPKSLLQESQLLDNVQVKGSNNSDNINYLPNLAIRRSQSYEQMLEPFGSIISEKIESNIISSSSNLSKPITSSNKNNLEKFNILNIYEKKVENLTKALVESEREHRKKIAALKYQYERHIKNIINEHNKGVVSIQTLHEETLSDVIKIHDIEIENLRAISIEAMTKTEKLERENKKLKLKMELKELNQKAAKLFEVQKRKLKPRTNPSYLTKTDVEAFNVKPKGKSTISCTCAINTNVSNVIRNIFEQVDVENKIAEQTYFKHIAVKMIDGIEKLTAQELSFLHLKVCQIWKTMRRKALKGTTQSSGQALVSSDAHPEHRHGLDLDKVIKDRLRYQERRKGACKILPVEIKDSKKNKYFRACVYKANKEAHHIRKEKNNSSENKNRVGSL